MLTQNSAPIAHACGARAPWLGLLAAACALFSTSAFALADGDADPTFDPNADNYVSAAALQDDGKIVLAGFFNEIGGQTHNFLVRLNPDGTVDPLFNPVVGPVDKGHEVNAILVQPDHKIVIGGLFETVGGQPRNGVARLNPDGTPDAFDADINGNGFVNALARTPGGKIIIGGTFNSVHNAARSSLARLNVDGTLDTDFHDANEFGLGVAALLLLPDGKLITGWRYQADRDVVVSRVTQSGDLDTAFQIVTSDGASLRTLALQRDGKIVIGGLFQSINGTPRNNIARLTANGSLDTSYDPDITGGINSVETLLTQPDGSLFVGGDFTDVGAQPAGYLVRLKPNGVRDTHFDARANDEVLGLAQQPDGQLIVVGSFIPQPGSDDSIGGQPRNRIARLFVDEIFGNGFE